MTGADRLPTIPGEHVGGGAMSLPDPATATEDTMDATLDAEHAGRVTITYQRRRMTKGKTMRWAWVAISASRAG